jgi:hypothetical protein
LWLHNLKDVPHDYIKSAIRSYRNPIRKDWGVGADLGDANVVSDRKDYLPAIYF